MKIRETVVPSAFFTALASKKINMLIRRNRRGSNQKKKVSINNTNEKYITSILMRSWGVEVLYFFPDTQITQNVLKTTIILY